MLCVVLSLEAVLSPDNLCIQHYNLCIQHYAEEETLKVSVGSEKSRLGLDVSNSILCSSSGETQHSPYPQVYYLFIVSLHTMQSFKQYLLCKSLPGTIWHSNCLDSLMNSDLSGKLWSSMSLYQRILKTNTQMVILTATCSGVIFHKTRVYLKPIREIVRH